MADTKVSNLNSITVADNNDVLYIVDTTTGSSNKITVENLLSGVNITVNENESKVTEFTNEVLSLSALFTNTSINLGPLQTDVSTLSGQVQTIQANQDARPAGVDGSFVISTSTFTFAGGQLTSVTP